MLWFSLWRTARPPRLAADTSGWQGLSHIVKPTHPKPVSKKSKKVDSTRA